MGYAKQKHVFGHMCSLIRAFTVRWYSSDTIKCISGKQMPGWDFVHALYESESVHFDHVQKHLFTWHGPYDNFLYIFAQKILILMFSLLSHSFRKDAVIKQGPVVWSVISLTSSLVLVSTISNSQVFLLKKCEQLLQMQKLLTFFQQKY